jgi:Domain of Unknown Function (DUF1080)
MLPAQRAESRWEQGPRLIVTLNGQKTADVHDTKHARGPFALQYGSGVIKFRKVQIKPL